MSEQLWNNVWGDNDEEIMVLANEIKKSIKTSQALKYILDYVKKKFQSLNGLNVLEIGAGYGQTAAKFGLLGANITLLDYSEEAIKYTKRLYSKLNIPLQYYKEDLFNISKERQKQLFNKFDICISFGLNEHFDDEQRKEIWYIHQKFLKENGLAIVNVPNANCILYRIWKFLSEKFHAWAVGFEKPYTISEISSILGYKPDYFGWSFYGTINLYIMNKLSRIIYNLIHYHSLRSKNRPSGVVSWLKGFKIRESIFDKHQSASYTVFFNK